MDVRDLPLARLTAAAVVHADRGIFRDIITNCIQSGAEFSSTGAGTLVQELTKHERRAGASMHDGTAASQSLL